MHNRKTGIGKHHSVIILLLMSLLLIPIFLFGEKAEGNNEGKFEDKVGFELTLKDDLVSLSAKDASLREIMEEIGNSMKIDVIGNIPEEEKISVEFDRLSLKDALEKLSARYGYVMDTEKGEKKITKIIILPKGKETSPLRFTARYSDIQDEVGKESKRPEPFKFEFDPSEFIKAWNER